MARTLHQYYMKCLTTGYSRTNYWEDIPFCVIALSTKYLMTDWTVQGDNNNEVHVHMENPKALKPQLTVTVDKFNKLAFGPELKFNSLCGKVYVEFAWYGPTYPMQWGLRTFDPEQGDIIWVYLYPEQGAIIRMEFNLITDDETILLFYSDDETNGIKLKKLEKVQWTFGCRGPFKGQFEKFKILDYGFALDR
eukprot:228756_1